MVLLARRRWDAPRREGKTNGACSTCAGAAGRAQGVILHGSIGPVFGVQGESPSRCGLQVCVKPKPTPRQQVIQGAWWPSLASTVMQETCIACASKLAFRFACTDPTAVLVRPLAGCRRQSEWRERARGHSSLQLRCAELGLNPGRAVYPTHLPAPLGWARCRAGS